MRPLLHSSRLLLVLCLVGMMGCDTSTPDPGQLVTGTWGGIGLRVTLTASGGTLLYDCGQGTIDFPLTTDGQGRFDTPGTFAFTPGPEPEGGYNFRPAIHTGQVLGNTMTMTVMLSDSATVVNAFDLTRGDEGTRRFCR